MKHQLSTVSKIFSSNLFLWTTFASSVLLAQPCPADTLKGGVKEKAVNTDQGYRLNRNNGDQGVDPFNSGSQKPETASPQPRPGASDQFDTAAVAPQPFVTPPEKDIRNSGANRPPANRRVDQSVPPPTTRVNIPSSRPVGNVSPRPLPRGNQPVVPDRSTPTSGAPLQSAHPTTDPAKSDEMQLGWDRWHMGVAAAIYNKFDRLSRSQIKTHAPLACKITYVVNREGSIENLRVVQGSGDASFDGLVVSVVNSVAHSPVLQFPRGSQRQAVDRSGTFTLNQSQNRGFKYEKGDKEQVRN